MWETIKNDPILKTVAIIVLSVLGFGFAFNIMFGPNHRGMDSGEGMGGGYSLGDTLSAIFILAFKLLLIALVVAAFIALFKFAKKHLIGENEVKAFDSLKKDPVFKGIVAVVLLLVGLGLLYYLFANIFGFNSGYVRMNGYSMMGYNGYGSGASGLLAGILKILLALSVIGVVIGLVMFIKQNYGKEIIEKLSNVKVKTFNTANCSNCGASVSGDYKFCPKCGKSVKETCSSCGIELKNEWKCCPACGKEKAADETATEI